MDASFLNFASKLTFPCIENFVSKVLKFCSLLSEVLCLGNNIPSENGSYLTEFHGEYSIVKFVVCINLVSIIVNFLHLNCLVFTLNVQNT